MMRTVSLVVALSLIAFAVVFAFDGRGKTAHADDQFSFGESEDQFSFLEWMCDDGQVLQGITGGEPVCVDLPRPQVRHVTGTLVNATHSIYGANCNQDEVVVGGRCQCHASGTWLAGIVGNGYQCACTAHPQHTGAVAVCMRWK